MKYFVVFLEIVSLLRGAVPSNGRYVDHSRSKLDESAAFERQTDRGEILETVIDKILQHVFAKRIRDTLQKRTQRRLLA